MPMTTIRRSLLPSTLLLAGLVACSSTIDPPTERGRATLDPLSVPLANLALKRGSDCTTLRTQLVDAFVEETVSQSYYYGRGVAMAEDAMVAGGEDKAADSGNPDGVSRTNLQEEGVDEADIVKTASDGTLYYLRGNQLSTVDAFPANAMQLTDVQELTTPDPNAYSWAHGLYLDEDTQRIVALQSSWGLQAQAHWTSLSAQDPTQPSIDAQLTFEGDLLSSRRVGNRVHLVLGHQSAIYNLLTDRQWSDYYELVAAMADSDGRLTDSQREQLRQSLRTSLAAVTIEQLLPSWVDTDGTRRQLVACEDVYHSDVSVRPALMSIVSVELDGSQVQAVGLTNYGWLSYASPERLYVVQNGSDWWWQGANSTQSVVYGFTVGADAPAYMGYGVMDGYVYSSFALSDYDGHLRVAHTLPAWLSAEGEGDDVVAISDNAVSTDSEAVASLPPSADAAPEGTNRLTVFTLPVAGDAATAFPVAGTVPSFADGEQIYAVRYLGDKAYVVTFRTVDPLFAFDLSDPRQPRITGELEIPGFSTYIHPIDATTLLTIGYGGTDEGMITELELKLFDVSDPAKPVQLQTFPLATTGSYAYSEASYDHHAFTYYAPRQLFVLPVVTWSETAPFAGIVAVTASRDAGFALVGRVSQKDLAYDTICGPSAQVEIDAQYMCQYGDYIWAGAPRRSVVMTQADDTYLYSISDLGIKSVDAASPNQTLDSLVLEPYAHAWWYYGYE